MIYIVRNADSSIKTYSAQDDDVLQNGETRDTFAGSLADFAARFVLSADQERVLADDTDQAVVTVESNMPLTSLDVTVNGTPVTVNLTNGIGQLPPITAGVAGEIVIQPADRTQFAAAGTGTLLIIAEEV